MRVRAPKSRARTAARGGGKQPAARPPAGESARSDTAAASAATHASLVHARRVLGIEAAAIRALADRLDGSFVEAIELIAACAGKVVVTGMGKSGHVCRKIAATLASTGTPAFFLHAAEALHGDLGMVERKDLVLAVSNSGETEEILDLVPILEGLGLPLVAMTGVLDSTLARAADIVLDVSVAEEACPLGLAPTASTTATLAMGDALAVALLEHRGFRAEDFAALHPAGALGRKLLKVLDVMHRGDALPRVATSTPAKDMLLEITSKRLGVTAVVDESGRLAGVVTDGDLRRALAASGDLLARTASAVMSRRPKTIAADALAAKALAIMEQHAITSLFVVDDEGRPTGVVHLHDLLRARVV
ncbi:MAG: KpsF/GutQ family sugar-phosphate isomerase [Deltaproteobacteria bacterium]|nr:KpsF/GutQ family sugar-phosphate isomerase [Deltaproteobacteria bacterium]